MRKIIVIFFILLFLSGCKEKKIEEKIIEEDKNIEEKEIYIDENNIALGFYDDDWNKIEQITNLWVFHKDIGWPWIFPINKEKLEEGKSKDLWQKYWESNSKYKFGLEIAYSLISGEKIELTILKPSDNSKHSDYVEIYFYDGYNATTSWFDHLEDNEINDVTVYTSIKVTSGKYIDQVISPLSLKVFTYDGLDDFDEEGKYRGKSYSTLIINKK